MREKRKNILLVTLAAAIVFGLSAACLLLPPRQYSLTERRILTQKPELSASELMSGKYMSQFEDYSLDQFPLRDLFRSVKAYAARYLFLRSDNNGIYTAQGHVSKLDYPLNASRLDRSAGALRRVYAEYVSGTDCTCYLCIIPDKNYYLAAPNGYPALDYEQLERTVREGLEYAEYIDISGVLSLDSYYRTDPHWRQEKLSGAALTVAGAMGADVSAGFTDNVLDVPFYGAYAGQSALILEPDTLHYLTNDILDGCTVTSFDTGEARPAHVYDMEKAHGRDPYEMFMSGSDALLVLENPSAVSDRELVVFRDSFAGSLIPLLASGYQKITLVDLRYIRIDQLGRFIDFDRQDVLFLYSTLALNSSISMT